MNKFLRFIVAISMAFFIGCATTPKVDTISTPSPVPTAPVVIEAIPNEMIGQWRINSLSYDIGTTYQSPELFILNITPNTVIFPNGDAIKLLKAYYDAKSDAYAFFFDSEIWILKISNKEMLVIVEDPQDKVEIVRFAAVRVDYQGSTSKRFIPQVTESA